MAKGTVKWFNSQIGYGFIQPEDGGADAFVHISALQRSGIPMLDQGMVVEFELVQQRNGKMAAENLKLAE